MLRKEIRQYLDAHRDQHLVSLMEFLRFPSVANAPDSLGEQHPCRLCAGWLAGYLQRIGLEARIEPGSRLPYVIAHRRVSPDLPTLLIYGHYDVQPAGDEALWDSPPFEPQVRDGRIYARGANDDKGQFFTHLMALEAWLAAGELPLNVTVFAEGEEEIGSPTLEPFVRRFAGELTADACVLSDSEFFAPGVPSITYSLRGLAYVEITVTGPALDLHSGLHGGAVTNPINALARIIADLHDASGEVLIPGFYDDVLPLTDVERNSWAELPFGEEQYARELGVRELAGGEAGYSVLERRWARPTLDCNGIVGGYTGPGSKTVIPSTASAKLSMRLVPRQDPDRVIESLREYLTHIAPKGVSVRMDVYAGGRPVLIGRHTPAAQAAADAFEEGFGHRPVFIRCGASVPITEIFQRVLKVEPVLMGFGLPDDNLHAPNEKFDLAQLFGGSVTSAAMIQRVAQTLGGES